MEEIVPESAKRTKLAEQIGNLWSENGKKWTCWSYEPGICSFCYRVWKTEQLLKKGE